jgi:hypothetical protein
MCVLRPDRTARRTVLAWELWRKYTTSERTRQYCAVDVWTKSDKSPYAEFHDVIYCRYERALSRSSADHLTWKEVVRALMFWRTKHAG